MDHLLMKDVRVEDYDRVKAAAFDLLIAINAVPAAKADQSIALALSILKVELIPQEPQTEEG